MAKRFKKQESEVLHYAFLRRRVHSSWKITLMVALGGSIVFWSAGLVNGWAALGLILAVFLVRPVAEIMFSRVFFCPRCGGDIFLDVCQVESRGAGVEQGVVCSFCGVEVTHYVSKEGNVVDID